MNRSPLQDNKGAAQPAPEPDRLLTVAEVAAWLQVTESWVRAHACGRRAPAIPAIRVSRAVLRFKESELNDWARRMGIAAE